MSILSSSKLHPAVYIINADSRIAHVAVVVSCLPSFRSFFSGRSLPYYHKDRTPSLGSRLSRISRSGKGVLRLNALPLNETGIASRSHDSEDAYGINKNVKLAQGKLHTGYTAGAKGPNPLDQIARLSDESQEHILPKPPENSVLVRNDIVSTEAIVAQPTIHSRVIIVHDLGDSLTVSSQIHHQFTSIPRLLIDRKSYLSERASFEISE